MRFLYKALPKDGLKRQIEWDSATTIAFKFAKQLRAKATMLSHLHMPAWTALTVNASNTGIGGIVEESIYGLCRPLAFFSRQQRNPEQKYGAFDR